MTVRDPGRRTRSASNELSTVGTIWTYSHNFQTSLLSSRLVATIMSEVSGFQERKSNPQKRKADHARRRQGAQDGRRCRNGLCVRRLRPRRRRCAGGEYGCRMRLGQCSPMRITPSREDAYTCDDPRTYIIITVTMYDTYSIPVHGSGSCSVD